MAIAAVFLAKGQEPGNFQFKEIPAEAPIPTFRHPWQGKRVVILGDSISDPNLSKYFGNKMWWSFLADWLEWDVQSYAVSGREWNDIPRQAGQIERADAILIFMGTNDYNMGVPTGEWFTETEETVLAGAGKEATEQVRRRRLPVMDSGTVKGRINMALSLLKSRFPDIPVVLLTPIHRSTFSVASNNIQPDETYANGAGEFFDSYIEAVKEAGNIWAVPVIDLNALSGLYPLLPEQEKYFRAMEELMKRANPDFGPVKDLLHPSIEGNRRIASVLYYQLAGIVCGDL